MFYDRPVSTAVGPNSAATGRNNTAAGRNNDPAGRNNATASSNTAATGRNNAAAGRNEAATCRNNASTGRNISLTGPNRCGEELPDVTGTGRLHRDESRLNSGPPYMKHNEQRQGGATGAPEGRAGEESSNRHGGPSVTGTRGGCLSAVRRVERW